MSEAYEFSPQGYNYNIDPKGVHPFWEAEEEDNMNITATALVDENTGTPAVTVRKTQVGENINFEFDFRNLKGEAGTPGDDGAPGRDGTDGITPNINVNASVDSNVGTPSVEVNKTGTQASPNFNFAFHNLKGAPGQNGVTPEFTVNYENYNDGGSPRAEVLQYGPPDSPSLDFEFYNLEGGGGGGNPYQYYVELDSVSSIEDLVQAISSEEGSEWAIAAMVSDLNISLEIPSSAISSPLVNKINLNSAGGYTVTPHSGSTSVNLKQGVRQMGRDYTQLQIEELENPYGLTGTYYALYARRGMGLVSVGTDSYNVYVKPSTSWKLLFDSSFTTAYILWGDESRANNADHRSAANGSVAEISSGNYSVHLCPEDIWITEISIGTMDIMAYLYTSTEYIPEV